MDMDTISSLKRDIKAPPLFPEGEICHCLTKSGNAIQGGGEWQFITSFTSQQMIFKKYAVGNDIISCQIHF